MNNWEQFQSTPKLLPPTVFEKTNINNTFNNESSFNISTSNKTNSRHTIANLNENESLNRGENTQFTEFSSELERLKLEIKKLHSENEILRHKNRGYIAIIN